AWRAGSRRVRRRCTNNSTLFDMVAALGMKNDSTLILLAGPEKASRISLTRIQSPYSVLLPHGVARSRQRCKSPAFGFSGQFDGEVRQDGIVAAILGKSK